MFHPSSNRLAGFLEISALSIALAQSGGAQYKAGYMRIEANGGGGGFGRKSLGWREKKMQRWCAVRESYLVVLEEPGEVNFPFCLNAYADDLFMTSLPCGMSFYWTQTSRSNVQNVTIAKVWETFFMQRSLTT